MKVGIIIICYNISPEIFILQINAIRKFCKDDFEIYDQKVPKRIYEAANCYYDAINLFFAK